MQIAVGHTTSLIALLLSDARAEEAEAIISHIFACIYVKWRGSVSLAL